MLYLDRKAAETFFSAVFNSYNVGLIGHIELCHYLNELLDLIDRETIFAEEIKRIIYCHWGEPFSDESEQTRDVPTELKVTLLHPDLDKKGSSTLYEQDLFEKKSLSIEFISSVNGMNKWEFHAYDADPFPSVPHGHWKDKGKFKLNPYSGRAYDTHNDEDTRKRLSRSERIALWNDAKFRRFALNAISWYTTEYPKYDFGIPHPFRLPRFR